MADFIKIAKVVKTHGYKGAVKIKWFHPESEGLNTIEAFFVLSGNEPLPYFREELYPAGKEFAIVKFEGISTKEEAAMLKGLDLLAERGNVTINQDQVGYGYAVGFEIIDENLGLLGTIDEIYSMPAQDVAKVMYKGSEVLVPLHKDQISGIDKVKKVIYVKLPDGLIEVYTNQ